MRLLGLDFETTGVNTGVDRATELGLVLWDWEGKRPLVTFGLFLKDEEILQRSLDPETGAMMERVSGIKREMLEEFGMDAGPTFKWLEGYVAKHSIDYVVAHNGENFDKPLLYAELQRHKVEAPVLRALPWIDSQWDLPFATEPDSRKLKYMAADHGILNLFAHRAVFDVLTMLRIVSNYDMEKVLGYQKIPFITVRAVVSYEDRELAKARRFSWEKLGEKVFPKCWVKRIKENMLETEQKACPFKIVPLS